MLVHVDSRKYRIKPSHRETGGIKKRFARSDSVRDMSAKQIAACLTSGRTIEPGVCPLSDKSRSLGKTGTVAEDFTRQKIFLNDIDNKRVDVPKETPAHVAEVLAQHDLKPAFMYETFSSTPDNQRFRVALVSDVEFTDKAERDRVQAGFIRLFPQADTDCSNADRVFFGTDKGLIEEYTDFDAVCGKADLLALADKLGVPVEPEQDKPKWTKFGETIPVGQRHGTLISFAAAMLTKYGISDKAHEAFMKRVGQCEEPKPEGEIEQIWKDACKNYEKNIAAKPGYVPPDKYLAEEFEEDIEPQDYTDVGQAQVLVNQYGHKLRYSPATKWLVYDGKRWNESELKAQKLAQELTDRQLKQARKRLRAARKELDTATETGDEDKIRAANLAVAAAESYRSFVLGRRKSNRIAATLTEARPAVEIDVSELDRDGFLLNTPAGTVDLRTGKMRPHDPKDYITRITAVSPSFEGMEMWLEFLERLTTGDGDLQEYLQVSSGMEAVGNVYLEKIMLAYGSGGNGKSTYYNSKARTLGDYSGCLSAETLTVNSRKNKSPEYAELRGKRLVIAAELEEGMRLDTAAVKNLCSIDPIQAEKKYKDPFHFTPSHTTVLYTNHLPKVGTIDSGTWDRLVVIPFNARFRGEQGEILNYADYLFKHCGGAILSWIIEGARKFIEAKFHIREPECVKRAIAEYHADNDWLEHFLADRCEIDSSFNQKSGELYAQYKDYCDSTGEYRRSLVDFKRALSAAGFVTRKTMYGAVVYGLRVLSDFTPVDEPAVWADTPTLMS